MDNLEVFLNYRFGFSNLGMGPGVCISNKLFGTTTVPQNTLNVEELRVFFKNHSRELEFDRV